MDKDTRFNYTETAWKGLGTKVEDVLTAKEAIKAAGLDWGVETVNIFHNYKGDRLKIENRVATRRDSDGQVLGIVTPKYSPVQNMEAFNFFDSVVGTGKVHYDTAGSIRNGRRVWIMAKLDGTLSIKGDGVDKYLLLMNSHDGSIALKMVFTPIRIACTNMLAAAFAKSDIASRFYAKHLGNITSKIDTAKEILGMTNNFYTEFAEQATQLATLQLPAPEFPKLLAAAFGTTGSVRPEDVVNLDEIGGTRTITQMERVQALFEGEGKGLSEPSIKGTRWAAYNAIVEYLDYGREYRGKASADNRLEDMWLGTPQRIKNRAWSYLTN